MNKKKHRKRQKIRRFMIAYLLRAAFILILIITITLMVCGCLYIYDYFTKEDDRYVGNDKVIYKNDYNTAPLTSVVDKVSEFCVVIDAGHGGSDGGTVGGEIIEKDINISVAWKLKAILEDNGIEVILTRSSDENMSLAQRTSVANSSNADFFISLHCNYYEDDAQIAGLECYYSSPEAVESKAYAESIIHAVSSSDDVIARDARDESYYVLRNTQMPAVLVELGFLSNDSECQKLSSSDYQEILSQKIAEGILQELTDNS